MTETCCSPLQQKNYSCKGSSKGTDKLASKDGSSSQIIVMLITIMHLKCHYETENGYCHFHEDMLQILFTLYTYFSCLHSLHPVPGTIPILRFFHTSALVRNWDLSECWDSVVAFLVCFVLLSLFLVWVSPFAKHRQNNIRWNELIPSVCDIALRVRVLW
jgi:hypothetical protein